MDISRESILEKYLPPQEDFLLGKRSIKALYFHPKQSQISLRNKSKNRKEIKELIKLRYEMEKARMLTSQVSKREKIKLKIQLLKQESFKMKKFSSENYGKKKKFNGLKFNKIAEKIRV